MAGYFCRIMLSVLRCGLENEWRIAYDLYFLLNIKVYVIIYIRVKQLCMITKKITKINGIKESSFQDLLKSDQIKFSNARLIPLLKTGDEMALTSIFLSALRLVKEFRVSVFKDLKIPKSGNFYYLTEVQFPDIGKGRFDGMLVVAKAGKIADVTIFEMKKENTEIDPKQIKEYLSLASALKIERIVTISNQFVSDPSQSPIDIKTSKKMSLYHFSWIYLLTKARILLYDNETNIQDPDQVEIMKEVLHYFSGKKSGVKGYVQMNKEWKTLTDNILAHKTMRESDPVLQKAITSWYQEEVDMALRLSSELGIMVKSKSRNKDSVKNDCKYVIKHKAIKTNINVKDAVSDILVEADFEKRSVKMEVSIKIPESGTNSSKVKWLIKQLEQAKKKREERFLSVAPKLYISADIKFARKPIVESLAEYSKLSQLGKSEVITGFKLYVVKNFGTKFTSPKGFVVEIEKLLVDFYGGCVQELSNWNKPAPKIIEKKESAVSIEISPNNGSNIAVST